MTREELKTIFPHASETFLADNADRTVSSKRPISAPVLERDLRDGALATRQAKEADTGKFFVRVTSFRRRLLDEDNLCEKYHVDCCRYSGVLPADSPDRTSIQTRQEKVRTKAEERTEIEVIPL